MNLSERLREAACALEDAARVLEGREADSERPGPLWPVLGLLAVGAGAWFLLTHFQ